MTRIQYRKNYITNVIFRVDFPKILDLDLKEPTSEFQRRLLERFPIMNEIKRKGVEFEFKDDLEVKKEDDELSWQFVNENNTKKVFIASDHVYIECTKYEGFEELSNDINTIFKAFAEIYPVKIVGRIGLRYINQIEINEGEAVDWSGLIKTSLYSVASDLKSTDTKLLRSMHLLDIKEEDCLLRFQFGLFNSEYPNPIARKEFVLDYDCMATQNEDITRIPKIAEKLHKIVQKWFENSIEDGLREKMGVTDGT